MAESGNFTSYSFRAAADLSACQWHVMRVVAAGPPPTCNIASNAAAAMGVGAVGVLQNAPASGEPATVAYEGFGKIVAGAATTAWGLLTTDASGRATDAASGDLVVARGVEVGASGQVISAIYYKPFRLSGAI
jgi:hypothetical protein